MKPGVMLRQLFRLPVYLYHWHLGRLLGTRFLLLTHIGRRSGLRRQTVLEVLQYRKEVPEAIVMSAFGHHSDWLQNIEAEHRAEVTIGSQHFDACHHLLDEQEAVEVLRDYESRNRLLAPIVRRVLGRMTGWKYSASDNDRQRLVRQLPLVAFRPVSTQR